MQQGIRWVVPVQRSLCPIHLGCLSEEREQNLTVKTMGFGVRAQVPSLLRITCVSLGKPLNHSEIETHFPHLQGGDNNGV